VKVKERKNTRCREKRGPHGGDNKNIKGWIREKKKTGKRGGEDQGEDRREGKKGNAKI